MDRNCVKIVYGDSLFKKKSENENDWLDYWSGRKKNNYQKKTPITGSIIGPAMAGPRNFVSMLVPGSGNFQLSRLAGLGYGLRFWVVFTIIVSLTQTLTLITTLTVILP